MIESDNDNCSRICAMLADRGPHHQSESSPIRSTQMLSFAGKIRSPIASQNLARMSWYSSAPAVCPGTILQPTTESPFLKGAMSKKSDSLSDRTDLAAKPNADEFRYLRSLTESDTSDESTGQFHPRGIRLIDSLKNAKQLGLSGPRRFQLRRSGWQ